MTLPEPIREFWYGACALGERSRRTQWGVVVTDSRYPRVWDANNAAVMEGSPGLTMEEIRSVLIPAIGESGATHEHIEFWETSVESPAIREMRHTGERPDPDVAMLFEGPPALAFGMARDPGVAVEELTRLDATFWRWYRDSLKEFRMELADDLLDQMVDRVQRVFLPHMRFFVGYVDGEMAGYTSLLSLAGVGYLDNVVTMPEFRRRGIASATVTRSVQESLASDARAVFLLAEQNGAPQRLYERLGFRVRANIDSFTRPLQRAN